MPLTSTEWDAICVETRDKMAQYVAPSVTAISQSDSTEDAYALGTGNYIAVDGHPYLLTNEHVAAEAADKLLAHLPVAGGRFALCTRPFAALRAPYDVAIMRLSATGDGRWQIPTDAFDLRYDPVPHELLFWLGYPGTTGTRHDRPTTHNAHRTRFGELTATGFPVVAQAMPDWPPNLSPSIDPTYHSLIHYPEHAKSLLNGPEVSVVSPHGMSGSLLWDTKRVARMNDQAPWSVDQARVCGLVWAALSSPDLIVATKIEWLNPFIKSAVVHPEGLQFRPNE